MTKCPMCKNIDLQMSQYEGGLPISECPSCGGAWIRANEYGQWLKSQTPGKYDLSNASAAINRFPITDSHKAAVCPDCGHFLRTYKVASNIDFHLDRCVNCNGVWLDKNEWQALMEVDLQDEINQIFTQPWQKHIEDEITAHKLDEMYLQRFGKEDYEKIKQIRQWLRAHPNSNLLTAYLLDKDPYTA